MIHLQVSYLISNPLMLCMSLEWNLPATSCLTCTLSKSQVLLGARGKDCLLGKSLTWNGFISLL